MLVGHEARCCARQTNHVATRRRIALAALGMLIPIDSSRGSAQPVTQAPVSVVIGKVEDSAGMAIDRAQVSIAGSSIAAQSVADGRFILPAIRSGTYIIETRALGFVPERAYLNIAGENDTLRVRIVLTRLPSNAVVLPATRIVAEPTPFERSSGFAERKRRGNGLFFDRAAIERRNPVALTDMLRGVPGLTLRPVSDRFGQSYDAAVDRVPASGGRACRINYYLNGNEYTPSAGGIDHEFPPEQVEAIEVYRPSETPAQFSGSRARCGAVLIWTRVRAHEIKAQEAKAQDTKAQDTKAQDTRQ